MEKLWNIALLFSLLATPSLHAQAPSSDSSAVWKYLVTSEEFFQADQIDSAEAYIIKATNLSRTSNYEEGIVNSLFYHLAVHNRRGHYQEGLECAEEALTIAQGINNKSLLAMSYNNVGNQKQYLGDLRSSATNYLNALIFSEGVDGPQRRQRYSNNLASVFLQMEEKNKSYYYAKKSYDLALETKDSAGMASSLVNLASAEVFRKQYEDAMSHFEQVYLLGKALRDNSYVLDGLINKADVHSAQEQYRLALNLYRQALHVLKEYPAPDYELYVYWGLSKNYFHLGEFSPAKHFLERAISVGKSLDASQELSKIFLLASEIYESTGEYAQAIDFRKQYEATKDTLVSKETQQTIHALEIEYQTAQKEKAIADQELEIARGKLEVEQKDKYILLWSALAVILCSAIALILMYYRNYAKRNKARLALLEKTHEVQVLNAMIEGEEKERSRLARELHDGVGGILSASKMHLSVAVDENTKQTSRLDHVVSMIDQAAHEIRTIAHNLFPEIVRLDLGIAISNFCSRIKSSALDVEYIFIGQMPALNDRFKLIIYRTVQELINNVIKHANASRVLVQVSVHGEIMSITVEDNGRGFDLGNSKGMGLTVIRQRIKELNGHFTIESSNGMGTTAHIELDITAFVEHSVEPVTEHM